MVNLAGVGPVFHKHGVAPCFAGRLKGIRRGKNKTRGKPIVRVTVVREPRKAQLLGHAGDDDGKYEK